MNKATVQTPYSLIGDIFTLADVQKKYNIPDEEALSLRTFIRIYPEGSTIIREGDTDKTLFLIRGGMVGVYRMVGEAEQMLGIIEAVNFVGEMSCIIDVPRSATVRVLSQYVLVYAISRPNLNIILANIKWADLLVTRFCTNLYQANNKLVAASLKIQELTTEIEALKHGQPAL